MNLQAMIDTDDIEKVIQLLEQNNWDESQAFSAHAAQQIDRGPGHRDANGPANAEENKGDMDGGVRAPVQ